MSQAKTKERFNADNELMEILGNHDYDLIYDGPSFTKFTHHYIWCLEAIFWLCDRIEAHNRVNSSRTILERFVHGIFSKFRRRTFL